MSASWEKDIWLGMGFTSAEHILGTIEGKIVRSGAVKAHPEIEWDSELFDATIGSPWDSEGKSRDEPGGEPQRLADDIPRVVVPRGADEDAPSVPLPRRPLISRDLLDRYGYTDGCVKCQDSKSGSFQRLSRAHSAECRNRI